MVEGNNKNISSNNSLATPDSQPGELITWIRSLQQALTVEVDHGFNNIQGRTNKFSFFVSGKKAFRQWKTFLDSTGFMSLLKT